MIVFVLGLPGSGKSYFARRLAEMINAEYISSDIVRKTVYKTRTYSPQEKLSVYDTMLVQMEQVAKQNKSVVLDATFYKESIRKRFVQHATKYNKVFFLEVRAEEGLIRERLKNPGTGSEADFKVYEAIKKENEPLQSEHLVLQSTNSNIDEMLAKSINYLQIE